MLGLEINVDYLALWPRIWAAPFCTATSLPATTAGARARGCPARAARRGGACRAVRARAGPAASAVAGPGIVGHTGESVVAPDLYWETFPSPRRATAARSAWRTRPTLARWPSSARAPAGVRRLRVPVRRGGHRCGDRPRRRAVRGAHGFGGEIRRITTISRRRPARAAARGRRERLVGQDAGRRLVGWGTPHGRAGPRPDGRARCWPSGSGRPAQDARGGPPGGPHAWHRRGRSGRPAPICRRSLPGEVLRSASLVAARADRGGAPPLLPAGDGSACQVLATWLGGQAVVRGAACPLAGAWWPTCSPTRRRSLAGAAG